MAAPVTVYRGRPLHPRPRLCSLCRSRKRVPHRKYSAESKKDTALFLDSGAGLARCFQTPYSLTYLRRVAPDPIVVLASTTYTVPSLEYRASRTLCCNPVPVCTGTLLRSRRDPVSSIEWHANPHAHACVTWRPTRSAPQARACFHRRTVFDRAVRGDMSVPPSTCRNNKGAVKSIKDERRMQFGNASGTHPCITYFAVLLHINIQIFASMFVSDSPLPRLPSVCTSALSSPHQTTPSHVSFRSVALRVVIAAFRGVYVALTPR